MNEQTNFGICDGVVVPESPLLKRQRPNPYGSVEGLPVEELASPAELERLYWIQEFAPVLALPEKKARKSWIRPNIDEDGKIELGAFGTVDFDRHKPKFDKMLCKADWLREEVANQCLMMETISARIKTLAKYKVIEYVKNGILDMGDIVDFDMYCLAERYMRTRRLLREIAELRKKSWEKRQEHVEEFWASL
ncbi:MAG: hypothetical protein ACYSTT_02230 [Planctomycetota bacterium]|jgi:hypothetical protein